MKVTLAYYNPDSGAYYCGGEYNTQMLQLSQIVSEVKWLMHRKELPTLNVGHASYTVAITLEGHYMPDHILYGERSPSIILSDS